MSDDTTESSCPFGLSMEKYWNRLSSEERQMKLDKEALYSLVIQPSALQTAKITPGDHVIDAFCGAGGSAIGFARRGKTVTAIELNQGRLAMARYNAELFGVADKITFIHGDSLDLIPRLEGDTIFLAPPWGGPEYTKRPLFTMECFSPNGDQVMSISLRCERNVVMQIPRNFDFNEFKRFGVGVSIIEDRVDDELLSYTAVVERK